MTRLFVRRTTRLVQFLSSQVVWLVPFAAECEVGGAPIAAHSFRQLDMLLAIFETRNDS